MDDLTTNETVETPEVETINDAVESSPELASRYGDEVPDMLADMMPAEGLPIAVPVDAAAPPETTTTGETPPEAVPAPEVVPDPLQAVRDQITDLTQAVTAQATPEAAPAPTPVDVYNEVPEYNFDIPDNLVTALNSEDPAERKIAIGSLMTGLSQTIHQQLSTVIRDLRDSVPETINQHTQAIQQQQQIQSEFYGKYPQLNNASLRPLVHSTAMTLMQQAQSTGQAVGWTPEFMDSIGAKVLATLNAATGVAQAAPVPVPMPVAVPPVSPPATFGGNTGGGANQAATMVRGNTTQQDFMASM